ncbi:MAG: SDR family NAD(P)-dependent oxidoreductase [Planctomycetaceae bacterium]|jgi:short-subunit dehydrogenase|nr:SDR family NAD(P)-dependent oxidoreductase [Planctomycetaceae bacterium]
MKRTIAGKRVLLTGASSGIGAALAVQLASQGAGLILLARRKDRLEHVAGQIAQQAQSVNKQSVNKLTGNIAAGKIEIIAGDVTDAAVRQRAVQAAQEKLGGLDFLINNAGAGATALLEKTTQETVRRLFEVNFFSVLELTQLALPLLKEGSQAMVVNLSSIVGLRGVPHYGAYGAAKFAVAGLSETMRAEFHRYGIDVLTVCPGTTQTEFFDVLYQASSAPDMPVHKAVTPQYVAERIIRAMESGRHKIVPYFQAVILDYLNRFAPRFVDWLMTRYV